MISLLGLLEVQVIPRLAMLGAVSEADLLEGLSRHRPALARSDAVIDQRELHVLERSGSVQELEALEHEADLAAAERR